MKQTQFRQGDVFLRRVDSLPEGLEVVPRDRGRVVLAYGEVTGHAHAITDADATLYVDEATGQRYLLAKEGVDLVHEEHSTIAVDRGVYEVVGQREYAPGEIRRVAD
jgi:hypothetical protein